MKWTILCACIKHVWLKMFEHSVLTAQNFRLECCWWGLNKVFKRLTLIKLIIILALGLKIYKKKNISIGSNSFTGVLRLLPMTVCVLNPIGIGFCYIFFLAVVAEGILRRFIIFLQTNLKKKFFCKEILKKNLKKKKIFF